MVRGKRCGLTDVAFSSSSREGNSPWRSSSRSSPSLVSGSSTATGGREPLTDAHGHGSPPIGEEAASLGGPTCHRSGRTLPAELNHAKASCFKPHTFTPWPTVPNAPSSSPTPSWLPATRCSRPGSAVGADRCSTAIQPSTHRPSRTGGCARLVEPFCSVATKPRTARSVRGPPASRREDRQPTPGCRAPAGRFRPEPDAFSPSGAIGDRAARVAAQPRAG